MPRFADFPAKLEGEKFVYERLKVLITLFSEKCTRFLREEFTSPKAHTIKHEKKHRGSKNLWAKLQIQKSSKMKLILVRCTIFRHEQDVIQISTSTLRIELVGFFWRTPLQKWGVGWEGGDGSKPNFRKKKTAPVVRGSISAEIAEIESLQSSQKSQQSLQNLSCELKKSEFFYFSEFFFEIFW